MRKTARMRGMAGAWLVVCSAAIALAVEPDRLSSEFQRIAAAARERTGAPGLSIAVVIDDRIEWEAGVGIADVEHNVPARADTVYRIASISKPIAATAVMQLVERSRVALDDPVGKYAPFFPDKGELALTVRHLMTHTSGIRHYNPGEMDNMARYPTVAEAARIFADDPLLFTPGAQYRYSTYAYNLLAAVVERASGLTYEAYLNEHVFDPAGMKTTFLEHPEQLVPNRSRQYVKADAPGRVRNAPYADLSVKWAGGGVISTVGDLARFHIALDEGRLLRTDTLREMYTPGRLASGKRIGYGLGWMVSTDERGRTWIAHSGGATGGSSYLLRNPEAKLAVAILCNVQRAGNLRAVAMEMAEVALARPPS